MKDNKTRAFLNIFGMVFLILISISLLLSLLKRGIWNENLGINLLVVGDDSVGVLVLRPKEGLGSWMILPTDLKVRISGSQAKYPINSLWKFAVGEKRPFQLSEKSLAEAMGVIIPRVIKVVGAASVESVLGASLSVSTKTDLSILDRFAIRKYLSEIMTSKRMLEINIPSQVYEKVEDPDGKIFLEFTSVMYAWSKDKFLFDTVLMESPDMIVNNLSGLSGAGIAMSRQAETAGIRVIEVKNDSEDVVLGRGCVFVSPPTGKVSTIELLTNHFGCKKVDGKGDSGGELRVWLL